MKNKIFIFIILVFSLMACDKDVDRFAGKYPCCFQTYINTILSNPPTTPSSHLDKYYYQGQYVYIFNSSKPAPYPDYLVEVGDENCKTVCYFGGIAGFKCPEWENAEFIEVVWEDTR